MTSEHEPTTTGAHHHGDDGLHDHDRGLAFDLSRLSRRRMLLTIGGAGIGAAVLAACGSDAARSGASTSAPGTTTTDTASTSTAATSSTGTATDECVDEIPQETAGPYPGDGTNGPNVLSESGIVRSDIRPSFGSSTNVADGVPLEVVLSVRDAAACAPLSGAAVYLWHCDAEGRYSMYSQGATEENYLRGVQQTDANGQVRFTTIVPGCYAGRWPHIHVEVFDSLDAATSGRNSITTSQLAFDEATSAAVYADPRYPQSSQNLGRVSISSDGIFGDDGGIHQLATTTGSVADGYVSTLTVGV